MSPENIHKPHKNIHMGSLVLGINTMHRVFTSVSC